MTEPVGFDRTISFRLREDEHRRIEQISEKLDERYFNVSHFVRCAVMKLIREEEDNIERIRRSEAKEAQP